VEKLTPFLYEFRSFKTNLALVSLKAIIFWDIEPYSPYINRRFGGTYHSYLQGQMSAKQETRVLAGDWAE
jgi:hypothetical protein